MLCAVVTVMANSHGNEQLNPRGPPPPSPAPGEWTAGANLRYLDYGPLANLPHRSVSVLDAANRTTHSPSIKSSFRFVSIFHLGLHDSTCLVT